MEIEEAINQRLRTDPAVVDLVGDRVYPADAAQGEQLPYVIYEEAEQQRMRTLTGYVNLRSFLLHIDCWGQNRAQAKAVRKAVAASLDGFQGTMGGTSGIDVRGVFHEGQDSDSEVPQHGEEQGPHRLGLDLTVWYNG